MSRRLSFRKRNSKAKKTGEEPLEQIKNENSSKEEIVHQETGTEVESEEQEMVEGSNETLSSKIC